jgi:hypothetical protein
MFIFCWLLERRRYTSARTSIWFFLLHDSSGAYIVLFPKNTIIAWDNSLSWLWENAMSALQETLYKVSVNRDLSECLIDYQEDDLLK